MIHLKSLGLIKLSPGESAKKLLQGQLTCDLETVSATQTTLGAHCNAQGRIISFFRLFMIGKDYYLLLPKTVLTIALNAIKKYAPFYKVILQDVSHELSVYGLVGDSTLFSLPKNSNEAQYKNGITTIRLPGTTTRYLIITTPSLFKQLPGLPKSEPEKTWKYLDITSGIPAIYLETSEKFLPHELQLHLLGAISFDKGCYTGQEIVARMQYRGKLKNHLYRGIFELSEPPNYGDTLADDGIIVDYIQMDYNKYEVLFISPESKIGTFNGEEITNCHGAT